LEAGQAAVANGENEKKQRGGLHVIKKNNILLIQDSHPRRKSFGKQPCTRAEKKITEMKFDVKK